MSTERGRAAVVGAAGFLGSAVRDELVRRGASVLPYTRAHPFLEAPRSGSPGATDAPTTDAITSVDTIFWLASSIRPATASTEVAAGQSDLRAVATLLDRLRASRGRQRCRVVVVSSGGTVYDTRQPPPHRETGATRAVNDYGRAMLAMEELVRAGAPEHTVLRVANAYGPGQAARRGQGVVAHWLDAVAHDEPITVLGDDDLARDYVYVDDVVAALVAVHLARETPPLLNIGSGTPTGLGQLVDAVRATVAPREVRVDRRPARGFDAPSTWLDVDRAADVLGWEPRVPLADGLARTWAARRPTAVPVTARRSQ